MRARYWLLLATLFHAGFAAADSAPQGVRWQPNLETAKRIAAQSNRLVLVHFWIEGCQPCRRMQEEVFSRDDVASTVAANYVPVQINAQYLPKTAREFGVEKYPTDVIITPAGDVVTKSVGGLSAPQYRDRLSRIAASVRGQPPTAAYAQAPSGAIAGSAYPGSGTRGSVADSGRQNPPSVGWPSGVGSEQYAERAPQGYAAPPWGTGYQQPSPSYQQPGLSTFPGAPGASGWASQPAAGPRPGPMAPQYGNETPVSYDGPGGPALTPPAQSPSAQSPPGQSPAGQWLPPQGGAPRGFAANPSDPSVGPAVPPRTPMTPSPGVAPRPAEPPPVGLDGYCPVQLLENNIWVRGTHEGGVIHRDRLYLCASPEERRRFLANPDLYAPALGGCDVVLAVDQNQLVQGHRKYGVRYEKDNRIYLFASQASSDRFAQDPGRYAAAVMRATASAAQRPAPPESPYGTSPGSAPGRRY